MQRIIRVDHVANYKPPKDDPDLDEITKILRKEGCAPDVVTKLTGQSGNNAAGSKEDDDLELLPLTKDDIIPKPTKGSEFILIHYCLICWEIKGPLSHFKINFNDVSVVQKSIFPLVILNFLTWFLCF